MKNMILGHLKMGKHQLMFWTNLHVEQIFRIFTKFKLRVHFVKKITEKKSFPQYTILLCPCENWMDFVQDEQLLKIDKSIQP